MFDILYHLNKGTVYNKEKENIDIVILLNLNAAKKAKAAAGFDAAFGYIMNAVNLLDDNAFAKEYKRSVEIFSEAIEISFLNNRYGLIYKFYEKLNSSVKDKSDVMKAREVLIQSLVARGKYKEAIEEGCLILEEFGEKVSIKPSFADVIIKIILTNKLLSRKTIDELYNMPEIKDPNQIYLIRIIKIIMVSAYQTDLNLVVVFIAKMLEITLKYGNSEISPIAYAGYASICRSAFGDIEKAYIYGNLSEKTSERFGSSINKYSVYMNQGLYVLPWKESLKTSVNLFREAYRISYENGDFEFATISEMYYTINSFYLGKPINEIEEQIIADCRKILRMRQKIPNIVNLLNYRLLLDISGNEDKITPLFFREFSNDELSALEEIKKDKSKYAPMRFMDIIKNYIFEDYDSAEKDITDALKYMKHLKGTMAEAFVVFYGALIYLSLARKSIGFDRIKYLSKAKKMEKKIRGWSNFAPENFNNKLLLIEAERLSIMNKIPQAIKKYEQSRKLSEENGFLHEKAIAIQLAGEFYKELGNESIAKTYIIKARFEFQNWGALKKVKQLEEKYPYYLSEYKESEKEISYIEKDKSSSTKKITGMLDSISLIKALEAISAEVVFEKLLNKMMEVMVENAGTEKGAFISINERGELFLEIKTAIGSIGKLYLPAIHFEEDFEIAASIVRYVVRNREVVVIDDSTKENMFSGDKYFIDGKAKSILCFPIIGQGRLSGVLYFENSQILGAFTPDRVEILKLLSGQIAISMEIAKLYGNLEEKVKERTKELEIINIVLGEQKKEAVTAKLIADEATKTKSEFLANMSHEIRTPLNGVIGLTYLLKETEITKKQKDYLEKIESSANHLLHVINDVLDFSKIESGRLVIEEHDFNLKEMIKQIYDLLMKSCDDKGLKLIHYIDPEIPSILYGDALRIQQILINLVGNAVKFTERGEIVIGIEVVEKKDNSIVLKFLVTDTGIGISKEQQERLFKSFTQADGSITRKYGGTGLGLAISKSFVELMGGSIGVISKEGEGSTFCFQLELGIGSISEIKTTIVNEFSREKNLAKKSNDNSTKVLSGKVLIVDDNMINQVIAEEILKSFGLIVDTASGGARGY